MSTLPDPLPITPEDDTGEDAIEVIIAPEPDDDDAKAAAPDDDGGGGIYDDPSVDPEISKMGKRAQEKIGHLTRLRGEAERREGEARGREQDAVEYAQTVLAENRRLQAQTLYSGVEGIGNAHDAAEARMVQAQGEYKTALDANDSDGMVEANTNIAKAAAEVHEIEGRIAAMPTKEQVDTAFKQPTPAPAATPAPMQQPAQLDPRGAKWMEKNSWFHEDPVMTSLAYGVEQKLTAEGVEQYSQEFFGRIDKEMRTRFPDYNFDGSDDDGDDLPAGEKPKTRKQRVAPIGRSQRQPGAKTTVRLTQREVDTAKRMGVPVEEYARQVALRDEAERVQ